MWTAPEFCTIAFIATENYDDSGSGGPQTAVLMASKTSIWSRLTGSA